MLLPYIDSSLNSSRRPCEEANRRPLESILYTPIYYNQHHHCLTFFLKTQCWFSLVPWAKLLFFSPSLPFTTVSHFHPRWWIGWLCVSLFSHSLFSSQFCSSYSPTFKLPFTTKSPSMGAPGGVYGYLFPEYISRHYIIVLRLLRSSRVHLTLVTTLLYILKKFLSIFDRIIAVRYHHKIPYLQVFKPICNLFYKYLKIELVIK
jgi:hypothetical protein